jgi:hypothetical protein
MFGLLWHTFSATVAFTVGAALAGVASLILLLIRPNVQPATAVLAEEKVPVFQLGISPSTDKSYKGGPR